MSTERGIGVWSSGRLANQIAHVAPPSTMPYTYARHQKIALKAHSAFNEKWVQQRIAEDPSILGLGNLILRDQERNQPGAGRLDLLLQDADSNTRYEVEIQLGRTDECHIFRAIEYWDLEKKRYPQYDHVVVLIAEDITSRFLNVISLLNTFIPLVAIQLSAIGIGDQVALVFTVILDQRLGPAPDEEDEQASTDRAYWEKKSSESAVGLTDEVLRLLRGLDRELDLKYNRFYIGVSKNSKALNFVTFRPKKASLIVEPKLKRAEDIEAMIDSAGLDVLEYDARNQRYRVRFSEDEFKRHGRLLKQILLRAYREFDGPGPRG